MHIEGVWTCRMQGCANWVKACTRYKIQETLVNVGLHTQKPVAYPEVVSGGVSKSRKCKWLVKVGASKGVTQILKNHGRGGFLKSKI